MEFGLDNKTMNCVIKIIGSNPKIKKRVIFGSRARGNYVRTSDIDIAIFGDLLHEDLIRLYGEFEESGCVYKIDIVHYESLTNNELKKNIEIEGIEF